MTSGDNTHARERARSFENLNSARQKASEKTGYDFLRTRVEITQIFRSRFGQDPYEWQLDVTEAVILGLDTVVIAGTSAGKTMPFLLPLLLDKKKKSIIISPLKILQSEQAQKFEDLGVSAAAINGDTWNGSLAKDIENGQYQGLFASPEMCLKHDGFRKLLTTSNFEGITAVIIDEAHCIAQWGGDFRTAYAEISKLRAFFPPHIPFYATSATMAKLALHEVCSSLSIDITKSFYLNMGNDRPNIAYSVREINSSDDYNALRPHLSHCQNPSTPDDLVKTIVFTNSVNATQLICRDIREWFPPHMRKYIHYLHAHRSSSAKRWIMKRFTEGKFRVLIATEAAGMGSDIPDIEQVIQFGVPSSLSVWIQRAGRAGRSSQIQARALLLVEKSMFQRQRKKRRKKPDTTVELPFPPMSLLENDDTSDSEDDGKTQDDENFEWKKKVDSDLRKWIEVKGCRRDYLDEYFSNPPGRKAPTGICCDNCDAVIEDTQETRPSTPEQQVTSENESDHLSVTSSPSKSPNGNGKREMATTRQPAARRGPHLQQACDALENWRFQKKRAYYTPSPLTASSLLPDKILKSLASASYIRTVEDLETNSDWLYASRHGHEVVELLSKVDINYRNQREKEKAAKALSRRLATQARQLEIQQAAEKKREQRLQERAERGRESENRAPRRVNVIAGTSVLKFGVSLSSPQIPLTPMRTPAVTPLGDLQLNQSSEVRFQVPITPISYQTAPSTTPLSTVPQLPTPVPSINPRPRPVLIRKHQIQLSSPLSTVNQLPTPVPSINPRPRPVPIRKHQIQPSSPLS